MNVKFNGLNPNNSTESGFKVATGEKKNVKQICQEKLQKERAQGKTLKGYDLNLANDPISHKLEKARKDAMRKLQDVMKSHMDVADDITKATDRIAELDKNILDDQKTLDELKDKKKTLAEQYADNVDSQEYMSQMISLEKETTEIQRRISSAKGEKDGQSKMIEGIHLALLKSDPMVGAQKEADKIMDAANKEVINDLVDEAKDKTDKKMEEQIEKAQEKKEEKKEEEKKKVERETEQDELKARIEDTRQDTKSPQEVAVGNADLNTTNDIIQTADATQNKLKDEIKNILKAQKLVEEDLKGLQVDSNL